LQDGLWVVVYDPNLGLKPRDVHLYPGRRWAGDQGHYYGTHASTAIVVFVLRPQGPAADEAQRS